MARRTTLALLCFSVLLLSMVSSAQEPIAVGDEAPDFELTDSAGKTYKLSDFRGKNAVVLEFFRSGGW